MAEMAYKNYKGRPEMAKKLKHLMWEEGYKRLKELVRSDTPPSND